MAQDASEIREAIEQTRENIGETLQAIGQKADVKARASEKVAETRDALKESGAEAVARLSEMAQQLEQRVPDAVQPAVSSTAQFVKTAARPAGAAQQRQKVLVRIGLATAVVLLLARRARAGK
ncbi:MAG TPA: DUF3618 domain-containing protein [Acidimicrobiales bacterium]|nr:DUF3618 domain-containing protein [Acidimicrobiales bacterium]